MEIRNSYFFTILPRGLLVYADLNFIAESARSFPGVLSLIYRKTSGEDPGAVANTAKIKTEPSESYIRTEGLSLDQSLPWTRTLVHASW